MSSSQPISPDPLPAPADPDSTRIECGRIRPFTLRRGDYAWRLEIFWGRLMVWLLCIVFILYAGLSAGAYTFVKYYRGVDEVCYLDLLLPSRWDHYRQIRSDHYIRKGKAHLEAGEWRAGYLNLRVGLTKNPANIEARRLLMQFFLSIRRPDFAEKILTDGLPYLRTDASYLQLVFHYFLQQQEDDRVVAISRQIIEDTTLPPTCRHHAVYAAAYAHLYRGDFDQVEDLLRTHQLNQTPDGRFLMARLEWERGYQDAAVTLFGKLSREFPKQDDYSAELFSCLRTLGRISEARQVGLLRQFQNPQLARPRIEQLYLYAEDHDTKNASRETEELLREFTNDSAAMLALGSYAASIGDAALARRVYDHCKARNLIWEGPALSAIEAQIIAKNYQAALDTSHALLKENPDWSRRYYALFNGLQAVAYFGLHDRASAQLYLKNFLGQSDLRSENLLSIAHHFDQAGAHDFAHEVLAQACSTDPLNQAALARLIEIDLAANRIETLPELLQRYVTMRRPSPHVLQAASHHLGSDRFLFTKDRTPLLDTLQATLRGKVQASL